MRAGVAIVIEQDSRSGAGHPLPKIEAGRITAAAISGHSMNHRGRDPMAGTGKSTTRDTTEEGFTAEERAAMKERAKELKTSAKRGTRKAADGESDVLEKIAEMPKADRDLAERIHAIVKENAPELAPKTWYGQPAYAKSGKVVLFFQSADKFKTRYATLGFNEEANLDDGDMWATAFALTGMSPEIEKRIVELVKKAAD
jgi:uncharacterized protein YdhG (YjbR/CyaY superfamily)